MHHPRGCDGEGPELNDFGGSLWPDRLLRVSRCAPFARNQPLSKAETWPAHKTAQGRDPGPKDNPMFASVVFARPCLP